jgi:hypothetical protein
MLTKAIEPFPQALSNPELIDQLPPESAVHATYILVYHWAQKGKLKECEQIMEKSKQKFVDQAVYWRTRACLDSITANTIKNSDRLTDKTESLNVAEKNQRLASGTKALMQAINKEPAMIGSMHLAPEFNLIRSSPEFIKQLSAYLLKQYPAE